MPDASAIDESLRRLRWRTDNEYWDAMNLLLYEQDPGELLRNRDRMKMELARYGHLGRPGDGLGWDHVEVRRIRQLHSALRDILKDEGPAAGLHQ